MNRSQMLIPAYEIENIITAFKKLRNKTAARAANNLVEQVAVQQQDGFIGSLEDLLDFYDKKGE